MDPKVKKRIRELEAKLRQRAGVKAGLFDKQLEAHLDPSRQKAVRTSRRAGKSRLCASDAAIDQEDWPGSLYCYIGLTRPSAERTGFRTMRQINREYGLGCHFQEAKLTCTFKNDAQLMFVGADQAEWIERLRGTALRRIYVDEAASYRINLRKLINEVLRPCLMDERGSLWLVGTPGEIPAGYFYDVTTGQEPGWSVYRWGTPDNPYMRQQYEEEVAELKRVNPDIESDPGFQREYLGEWVADPHGRVYTLASLIDGYIVQHATDHYVLGLDFGYSRDNTAYALACYSDVTPDYVVIESYKREKQLVPDIAEEVKSLRDRYPGLRVFGDPAARQLIAELRDRFGLPIEEADKPEKQDWIRIYNSDVAAKRVKFVEPLCTDLIEEQQELKKLEKPGGRWVEHPHQPNDCCDANLYAYRHAYHYRYEEPESKPAPGSRAALNDEMDEYWEEEAERLQDLEESGW